MGNRNTVIEQKIRNKELPNPYEIKQEDLGSWIDLAGGSFGLVLPCDVGKLVYLKSFGISMENDEQMNKRKEEVRQNAM